MLQFSLGVSKSELSCRIHVHVHFVHNIHVQCMYKQRCCLLPVPTSSISCETVVGLSLKCGCGVRTRYSVRVFRLQKVSVY